MITNNAKQQSAQVLVNNMLASWHAGHFDPSPQGKEKAIEKAQEFYKQDAIFDFTCPCAKTNVFKTYIGPKGRVEWCGITEQFEFQNYRTAFAQTASDEVIYCKNTWGPTIHKSSGKTAEEELSIMQEIHMADGKINCK